MSIISFIFGIALGICIGGLAAYVYLSVTKQLKWLIKSG